jgi:hypothetical protein
MRILKHLPWMVLGYAVAVVAATIVATTMIIMLTALPDGGRFGSVYKFATDMAMFFYVGGLITGIYAFPGWLISVIIAAIRNETRRGYFILAGVLTALLAHLIMLLLSAGSSPGYLFGSTGETGSIILSSSIGGAVGGWAYWRVAVVRFGQWRALS